MKDAGAHLDADEMNAYAEGALPPAARSRYTSHLAECRSCRAVVTDLVLAAQAADVESKRDALESASPSKSWWGAIVAALFAPPVLRYAVPAILLLGVIVVALVATRDRSEPQLVAQKEESQHKDEPSKQAAPEASPSQMRSDESSAGAANNSATTAGKTEADAPPQAPSLDGTLQTNSNADQTSSARTTTTETKPDANGAPGNKVIQRDEPRANDELYAKETPAAPPPPLMSRPASPSAGEAEEEKQKREQNTADSRGSQENSELGRTGSSKDAEARNRAEDRPSAASESAPKQSGAGQPASRMGARRAAKTAADKGADDNDRADNSTETRSVAGRRFQRRGDAWIDTAYSSSRSTINVARGSDQYRALAADEPGLRSIAEQLGGVVIVIWKGKAYRIY